MHVFSRVTICVGLVAVLLMPAAVSGQSSDPYSLKVVSAIESHYGTFSTGWDDTELPRLGDKGSIALVKLSSLEKWSDPDQVHKTLGMMRDFFSHPEFVENSSDRQPRVTLIVLSWLRSLHKEPDILREIDRTVQYVEEKTKPK
ncbi:MAG: hypothetical protein WAO20_17615 [Acidobacteriota bacterium]